jgi:FtsH-binding integral membrane protein
MSASTLLLIITAVHLGLFVSYPYTGRFGLTFLFVSALLWAGLALFIDRALQSYSSGTKAALILAFTLLCAFSTLSFLPQKDGISPLRKVSLGKYPARTDLYFGLLRLGVSAPGLLPPRKEEQPL